MMRPVDNCLWFKPVLGVLFSALTRRHGWQKGHTACKKSMPQLLTRVDFWEPGTTWRKSSTKRQLNNKLTVCVCLAYTATHIHAHKNKQFHDLVWYYDKLGALPLSLSRSLSHCLFSCHSFPSRTRMLLDSLSVGNGYSGDNCSSSLWTLPLPGQVNGVNLSQRIYSVCCLSHCFILISQKHTSWSCNKLHQYNVTTNRLQCILH